MSRFRKPNSRRAAAVLAVLVLAGCTGDTWPGPVPIDESKWDIQIDVCGPVEETDIQFGEGLVINTTDERSPFYDVRYTVVYTDGHTVERLGNNIIEPLDPGEAGEFGFALGDSQGRTVQSCEVIVTDAVENYNR